MTTRYDEIREHVRRFHRQHPEVYVMFDKFTVDRILRGFKHYSVNAIFERIRWETDMAAAEDGGFKLNNNFRAFYAREWMRKNPTHQGFFRLRKQKSKIAPAVNRPELGPTDFEEEEACLKPPKR